MLINSYMASTHQNWVRSHDVGCRENQFCHILDQLQHIWLQSFQKLQHQHVCSTLACGLMVSYEATQICQYKLSKKKKKKLIGENQQFLDELQEYSLRRKPKEESKENELKQNFCLFHQVSGICPKGERKERILPPVL